MPPPPAASRKRTAGAAGACLRAGGSAFLTGDYLPDPGGSVRHRAPLAKEAHPVKRVLTGRFMHETNTFSVQKTDMALWRRRDFHLDNEIPAAFRNTRSALGATFEAADKYGWVLVHPVSANANPSGIVADDAFE